MMARARLRQEFQTADMGITGGNFAIADTGMVAITENEGNARLSFSLARVHAVMLWMAKLTPRFEALALFCPLLAGSGTGQAITAYSSLIGGPRQERETDGP